MLRNKTPKSDVPVGRRASRRRRCWAFLSVLRFVFSSVCAEVNFAAQGKKRSKKKWEGGWKGFLDYKTHSDNLRTSKLKISHCGFRILCRSRPTTFFSGVQHSTSRSVCLSLSYTSTTIL